MKSRILAVLAAFGLGLGAHAATGDIFSITPCDQYGVNLSSAYTTYNAPVGAGKELYFKVTLATHKANNEYWRLSYVGIGPQTLEETYNPLQLGIFVSGRLQYASLLAFRKGSQLQQTEMIFRYVTKPGDFAMPIVLAASHGEGDEPRPVHADGSSAGYYYLNPLNKDDWKITFNNSDNPTVTTNLIECTWQPGKVTDFSPPTGARPALHSDSLTSAGFYVKTIDFSPDSETTEFWRTVHENSTITGGGVVPKLVIDAAPEVETSVYVWSDDESAVKIKGGMTRSIHTSADDSTMEVQVGTVTFKGGQVEAQDFQIEGASGGENRTANLILSAYFDFHYSNATGERIKDYLTAKVKCIEPLPPSIVVECDRNTAYASGNYTTYAAVLQVYLSQACADPVEVTLTPSFTDGATEDFAKYLRFSDKDTIDEPSADGSDYKLPTVTIPAGSTGKQTIYLYCLRSDEHTIGTAKIKLSSSTTSTEITSDNWGTKSINVSAEITDITTPAEGAKIATTCNDEYPFTLAVDDTYADTHDAKTGYQIYVKYRASDTFKQLEGSYYVGAGNALYKLDLTDPSNPVKTQNLPILKYTVSGEGLQSQVYVVAPVNPNTANAKKSVIRTFIADVKEARTVTITSFDEDFAAEKRSFNEGSDVGFRIKLSEKNETGLPIYAYIKRSANAPVEMFSCQTYNCIIGMDNPAGLPINNSQDSSEAIVSLLDGYAKPGLKITFEVLLSTDPNWNGTDMTKKLGGYDSNYLTITTYNIEPTIKRIEMNGNKSLNDGYTFPNKLPMGQEQKFQIYVNEPGTFDLISTEKPFKVRWTASLDGQTYDDPRVIEGDPRNSAQMFKYSFPAAGIWKITAEVKDKDMDDWSELDYSVYVTILDQPSLEGPNDVTLEENVLVGWKYTIGVSYYDPKYNGNLKVIVEVGEYSEGKTNPGLFKLDSKYLMSAADAQAAIEAAAIPGFTYSAAKDYYLVELTKSKLRQDLALEQLDGTDNSSIYGFTCVAHVINEDVLPTSQKKAKEYYLESNMTRAWINNAIPVFGTVTVQNTNAWKVAGTTATSFPIRWQVKSDVQADWTGGITIEFTGCSNADEGKQVIYAPASGTFIPKFTETGDQTVTMTIYDKDGGTQTWTYLYFVEPRKGLVVRPFGPASTTESYYDAALGLGKGRVYADGTLDDIISFVQKWSYGVSTGQAEMYATGYKALLDGDGNPIPYDDDGTLGSGNPKRDAAIGPTGEKYVSGPYYSYAEEFDNFFYRWVYVVSDDNGGASTKSYSQVNIQTVSGAEAVSPKLALDAYEKDKSSYLTREVEAIFSRENYVEDNLGDINGDGIPDLFMRVYKFDAFDDNGELVGNDLADHFVDWDDGDYLPNARSIKTVTAAGVTNTWATRSENFGPVQEIRGYNDEISGKISHFNDAYQILAAGIGTGKAVALLSGVSADIRFTDPTTDERSTLSYAEWIAYTNYCGKQGWEPSDDSHWGLKNGSYANSWSPERPTNPNNDDTDGDGLTDGFEYYLWYQAHVGHVDANGNQVRLTGRRYNIAQPMFPTTISADEIESFYDPLSKAANVEARDVDNDGLTDLEEFVIGTSPIDYDSDGDGLPDGYEIVRSHTDPVAGLKDGVANDDHDAMAYGEFTEWAIYPLVSTGGAVTNGFICASSELPVQDGVITGLTEKNIPVYDAWYYGSKAFARGRLLATNEVEGVSVGKMFDKEAYVVWAIHYDAYTAFGFDPRIGWKYDTLPYADLQEDNAENVPLHTKAFTHLDESMVATFYLHMDGFLPEDIMFDDENFSLTAFWTNWTTDPLNADTDGDGAPDGWELYDQRGPLNIIEKNDEGVYEIVNHRIYFSTSPFNALASDVDSFMGSPRAVKGVPVGDGLGQAAEFSGIESSAEYADCATITLINPEWRNKRWPTDQWNHDTDDDGIEDAAEGKAFLYGSSGTAGGGLNPCSWDTDGDGLPDPWELEFAGTFSGGETSTSTVVNDSGTNQVTTTASVTWNNDGMDGTVNDAMKDYDNDGLLNWQEYFAGTLRHFRYDDSVSQFGNQSVGAIPDESDPDAWGEFWYKTLVDDGSTHTDDFTPVDQFNPNLIGITQQGTTFDGASTYFSYCTNVWDTAAYKKWYYFKDGIYHDLRTPPADKYWIPAKGAPGAVQYNRFTYRAVQAWPLGAPYATMYGTDTQVAPDKYISCDPRMADTDRDGMDDYYELFHGLNPLLGASGIDNKVVPTSPRDVVFEAYENGDKLVRSLSPSAQNNWWLNEATRHPFQAERIKPDSASSSFDFVCYPWLAGLAEADPDGDDIRNQKESILPSMQASATYLHTDPTPLWMTDSSYDQSFPNRYYNLQPMTGPRLPLTIGTSEKGTFTYEGVTYKFADFPGFTWNKETKDVKFSFDNNRWKVDKYTFSFEENEGFDSDHDYLSDSRETEGRTKSASDPQQHDDPLRRQAMWFNGTDAFLETAPEEPETPPYTEASSEPRENYLYFTVEAWVKPDASTYAKPGKQIIVERSLYTGEAGPSDSSYVRKNFMLGISNGRWYTGYDSSGTSLERFEITDGPAATTNWTHLAATYDGANLVLYVNGIASVKKTVGREPEHGMRAASTTATGSIDINSQEWSTSAFLVGASAATYHAHIIDYYYKSGYMFELPTIGDYQWLYKGYIDEVRVWDGARSATAILSDYKNRTRYTSELALENRQSVYTQWKQGARRTPTSALTLPAQLMHHWTFDHLPGAVKVGDVMPTPAGFSAAEEVTDAKAPWVRPENWVNPWWASMAAIKSTVYSPKNDWVPWINDTVAHLPRLDKTTVDSVYWSADYAGASSAISNSLTFFAFPRSAEVFSKWTQMLYPENTGSKGKPYNQPTRWDMISEQENADELKLAYHFTIRNRNVTGDDLLPFGGAFPKRISASEGGLWDEQGAADAWAETGIDSNNDGLPDWWTAYALENYYDGDPSGTVTWDTPVNYHGVNMPAWQAYRRDLAKGFLPDFDYHDEYADTRDADKDGLPDWWEEMYGIQKNLATDADDDPDADGLSNYAEYLLSEVYPEKYRLHEDHGIAVKLLNPTLAHSYTNQVVTDYFLRYSADEVTEIRNAAGKSVFCLNEYFGEITSDHDFMEDWWEQQYGVNYVSSKKYDPFEDADEDGWSNWAECRAALWGGSFNAALIDNWTGAQSELHVVDYPEPIVGVRVSYQNGVQDIRSKPLVIRTISGQSQRVDATFVIPSTLDGQLKYIGSFAGNNILHGHLSPGQINPNSVIFYRAAVSSDKYYIWNCDWYKENESEAMGWDRASDRKGWLTWSECGRTHTGDIDTYNSEYEKWAKIELEGGDLSWEVVGSTRQASDTTVEFLINGIVAGTINIVTGEYEINTDKLDKTTDGYVFRVFYTTRIGHEWPQTVYVSDTRELSSDEVQGYYGSGRVREGRNLIEVFMDMNANGVWDQGEPFGSARNVFVGWHKVPVVTVELKDDSPIMQSVVFASAAAASETTGQASNNVEATTSALTKTVRITRRLINGLNVNEGKRLTERQLVTKKIVLDDHAYLTEADVVYTAKPDLDWSWLVRDAKKFGIENIESVTYSVDEVQTLLDGSTTNITLSTFVKTFSSARTTPTTVSPLNKAPVYSASPALRFSASDDKATGYRLQIQDVATKTLAYDSGVRILPGRVGGKVGQPVYEVTPPVFADMNVYAGETTNRFVFADGSNYQWRVALVNAKFNTVEEADYSAWAEFQMDVRNANRYADQPTGYGNVEVAVRYFGPTNLAPANVIVEAFENADFSGQPMAQVRLGKTAELLRSQGDVTTWNVILRGLRPGKAYFRAYFDQNDNGIRDRWESWGYANNIDTSLKAMYNPLDYVVEASAANWVERAKADVVIYMEDCDVNQNEYPDCIDDEGDWLSAVNADVPYWIEPESASVVVTDPMADTDGDGMPTIWENWNDGITDPLVADGDTVPEGQTDVMAYRLETTWQMVTIDDGSTDGLRYLVGDTDQITRIGTALAQKGANTYDSRDGLVASNYVFTTWYLYGPSSSDGQIYGIGTNVVVTNAWHIKSAGSVKVALVHAQVYARCGYNTLTANPNAYESGKAVNTKEFTALDRYLVMRYFEAIGATPAYPAKYKSFEEYAMNAGEEVWKKWTLLPGTVDANNDFVPDGWQLYVMYGHNLTVGAPVEAKASGAACGKTSPWGSIGATTGKTPDGGGLSWRQEYDLGNFPTDPWSMDTDGDTVTDYYAFFYHLKGDDAAEDWDGDGLSNNSEYLISEVFQFAKLDPDQYATSDGVCDYFRKVGDLYFGEIFQDHDQVDDAWERANSKAANYRVYDPSRDDDNDGWSNWAESKANTDPSTGESSVLITSEGSYSRPEYPVPVVKAKVVYHGKNALPSNLVFKAWSEFDKGTENPTSYRMTCVADGTWTFTSGEAGARSRYLGRMPSGSQQYLLSGGSVALGTFKLKVLNQQYVRSGYTSTNETSTINLPENAYWYLAANDNGTGEIVTLSGVTVGTIDYRTGLVKIDFSNAAFSGVTYGSLRGNKTAYADSLDGKSTLTSFDRFTFEGSHVLVEWTAKQPGPSVDGTYYLCDDTCKLREGKNSFICYASDDGSTFVPGKPFGVIRGVDVGWQGASFTIELSDTCAISPRVSIWDSATSDRSATFSEYASTPLTDRTATAEQLASLSNSVQKASAESGASKARIRVVRFGVNGMYAYRAGVGFNVSNIIDRVFDANGRNYLCEADFLEDGEFDIEWSTLNKQIILNQGVETAVGEVTSMTYLAVLEGGSGFETWIRGASDTNTVIRALATTIERRFEKTKHAPKAENVDAICFAARPTFRWSLPDEESFAKKYGTSYTAFKLKIFAEDGVTKIYDSGVRRAPAQDANGVFSWTADASVGDLLATKQFFATTGNYTWQVAMYNAKFIECTNKAKYTTEEKMWKVDKPSALAKFSVAVNAQQEMNDHQYSSIDVAVKYAGPSLVIADYADLSQLEGKVRVQAFATADFAGEPLSETVVTTKLDDFASVVKNVRLVGLEATGTYYIRAYIDSNGNCQRDAWESWGAAKSPVTLTTATITAPLAAVWIEDTDVDNDWLPDAWEYVKFGEIAEECADVMSDGKTIFTTATSESAKFRLASVSTGLEGSSLTIFLNGSWAKSLLGLSGTSSITFDDIRAVVQKELDVKADTFKITSLTLGSDGKVTLTVDAEVAPTIAGTLLSDVYGVTPGTKKTVTVRVWKKSSLAESGWGTTPYMTATVTIGAGEQERTIDGITLTPAELNSGFFKIDIVE